VLGLPRKYFLFSQCRAIEWGAGGKGQRSGVKANRT
jgi:hypothetical protein